MIEAYNLRKEYNYSKVAVLNLSLTVTPGELFGFLGPNGAGKTTTIKMMTGVLRPTSGKVLVGGVDIHRYPVEAKRQISFIPDTPYVYEKLTAWEHLLFMGQLYGLSRRQAALRAEEELARWDLLNEAHVLTGGMSHGTRQKIAICAALLHHPKVLFLDEPTVGLDPRAARQLKDLLRELADDGTTVFFSTHILEIAERLCDRVAIISKGELLELGTMSELRSRASSTGTLEDIFLQLTGEDKP